LNVLVSDGLV